MVSFIISDPHPDPDTDNDSDFNSGLILSIDYGFELKIAKINNPSHSRNEAILSWVKSYIFDELNYLMGNHIINRQ